MVATKRKFIGLLILGLCFYLTVSCSVENIGTAPNALNCIPSDDDVAYFQANVYSPVIATNCGTCHGVSATARTSRLKFQDISSDLSDQRQNLCIVYSFGQLSPSRAIVNHPQDSRHAGGRFTVNQLQPLIDWVNQYALPR